MMENKNCCTDFATQNVAIGRTAREVGKFSRFREISDRGQVRVPRAKQLQDCWRKCGLSFEDSRVNCLAGLSGKCLDRILIKRGAKTFECNQQGRSRSRILHSLRECLSHSGASPDPTKIRDP